MANHSDQAEVNLAWVFVVYMEKLVSQKQTSIVYVLT